MTVTDISMRTRTLALSLLALSLAQGALQAQTTQRNGLVEEYSSSSCPPCADMFKQFHPATVSIGVNDPASRVNVISYQLNFPQANNPSYNQDAQKRYNNTGAVGLPTVGVNGIDISTTGTQAQFHA